MVHHALGSPARPRVDLCSFAHDLNQVHLHKEELRTVCVKLGVGVKRIEGDKGLTLRAYAIALINFTFEGEPEDMYSLTCDLVLPSIGTLNRRTGGATTGF